MQDDYTVIDDFLNEKEFKKIKNFMMSSNMPWFMQSFVADEQDTDNFYFTHIFYNNIPRSNYFDILKPLLEKINIKALIRVKGNLYPREKKLKEHKPHADHDFSHKGCIFSINTCDGFTRLKNGTQIKSVENRALFFNPSELHNSSCCTDEKTRININMNFF